MTFFAALVASTSPVFTERSRRVRATTKRFVSPVLACLIVGGVQGRAAEVSRIELLPLESVTVTEEQFLTGSCDGRPVTIAVELRLPSTAAARVPAVVLLHGSGGANTRDDRWSRDLNDLGVATLLVDSFSGRGIVSTVADQSQLSELSGIIDAYRALELLAKHPRIDATRIGLLGGSRGGMSTLYASIKRFHRMYAPAGADFAVYMSFYPPCSRTYIDDTDVVERPIRLFHGTAEERARGSHPRKESGEGGCTGQVACTARCDGAGMLDRYHPRFDDGRDRGDSWGRSLRSRGGSSDRDPSAGSRLG